MSQAGIKEVHKQIHSLPPGLTTCMLQLCYAYRNEGGCTVVILVQRPKLEMEALFKSVSERGSCSWHKDVRVCARELEHDRPGSSIQMQCDNRK
jgi:hypothetical protein